MFVTRNGARLYCRAEGSGEPCLLFVHGGGVDHSTWNEHLDHFAPRHRVVAVDLRGHGKSDPAPSYTADTFRDDLVAVIDQLRLAPAVMVGASRGGGIANRAAVDHPNRVKALDALKKRLANLCRYTPAEVVVEVRMRDLDEHDREEYLRRIHVPTLILQSTHGPHQGREQGRFIHERVPGSRLHYFEGRGHGFFMSAPEEFWQRIEEFLATL